MAETKSIFLTLSGRTNAGKSTLLNALIGEKIASVSSKPQTTRTRITGILTQDNTQYVFIDTPGLHKPKNKLSGYMLKTAESSATDSDAVLYVIDCTKKLHEQDEI
ncbi:MAG: 50S ribosome-binding GTPase [Oscillospiraceae bacterium]|nr:50S ribosome-binding GTPase [Oscillospiraceae bacterium]